jgi:hypothetical protein
MTVHHHHHQAAEEGDQENNMNNIYRTAVFVAEPSNNAKMIKDLSIDPRQKGQMRRVDFRTLDVISQRQEVSR